MKRVFKHPLILILSVGLILLFFLVVNPSAKAGYGHAGYNNYNARPAFDFFVPVQYYGGVKRRSVREGSTSGPTGVGGGFSGGK